MLFVCACISNSIRILLRYQNLKANPSDARFSNAKLSDILMFYAIELFCVFFLLVSKPKQDKMIHKFVFCMFQNQNGTI